MPSEDQQVLRLRQTYLMRRLLLLPLLLGVSSPVFADLGEAEKHFQDTYEITCGKADNNCTVVFEENRLKVNNSKGITNDQVVYILWQPYKSGLSNKVEFTIVYKKLNKTDKDSKKEVKDSKKYLAGTFFMTRKQDRSFKKALAKWTGTQIGFEQSSGGGGGGMISLGDGGAGIRNANLQNQLTLQRGNTMNQINRMPPQYRGTVRPPF